MIEEAEQISPSRAAADLDTPYVVGVDVGGTKIHAIAARTGEVIVGEAQLPTHAAGRTTAQQVLATIDRCISRISRRADRLTTVAIGIPGVLDPATGTISRIPHAVELADPAKLHLMQSQLGATVILENDANLAALGEWTSSDLTRGIMAAIALGTGVGMGIVVDGQLLRGSHGAAGELADLGLQCTTGPTDLNAVDPLESIVSTAGLLEAYRQHARRSLANGADVIRAAHAGDRHAATALANYTRQVAHAVRCVSAVIDPTRIVLTGGLGSQPAICAGVNTWLSGLPHIPPVVSGRLGNRAGALGAVHLAYTHEAMSSSASSTRAQPAVVPD